MKKFTKVSLIISGIIFAAGIIFCLIGLVLGARYSEVFASVPKIATVCDFDNDYDISFGDVGESLDEPVELDKGMNLSLDIGNAELVVEKSDNGKFYVEAEGVKTAWNIKGDEIIVRTKHKRFFGHNNSGTISIYVPEDYNFKEVEVDCGAGIIEINDIVAQSIDLDIGAGEITAKNIDTKELSADCGAGSINVSGSVKEDVEIDCSMGEVNLEVNEEEKYYNYDIDCSMGEVNINGSSYSGMGVGKNIDNDSDYDMSIECSMGTINITTK